MVDLFPIDVFVDSSLSTPKLRSVISRLNLDVKDVRRVMIEDFREMGILFVEPRSSDILVDTMVNSLQNSIKLKNIRTTPVRRVEVVHLCKSPN